MKSYSRSSLSFFLILALGGAANAGALDLHSFKMKDIDGKLVELSDFRGKVVMVVNTASYCGFTHQFAGLETLYQTYKDQGFVILGFPSNDFLGQDPGSDAEIKAFCTSKYQVSFPMFSKIRVTGAHRDPLYAWLTDRTANPKTGGAVSWNFNKFLVGKDGKVVQRFGSGVEPDNPDLIAAIKSMLAN